MLRNSQITLLCATVSCRSITSAPRWTSISGRCHLIVSSKCFSSSARWRSTLEDAPPAWTNVREVVRPSATWLAPKGSKFDQQQVIDQLPQLEDQGEELPVVLLLVTPKLAHLFENNHQFHSRVVNKIYGKSAQGKLRQSIVAVVDALPVLGKLRGPAKPEIHGTEGIAVCISPGFDVQPAAKREGSLPLISMTARHPFFDGRRYVTVSWSGGVANTTFINGRQHTLFMQNWWNRDGTQWSPETKQQNLGRVDVQAYANRTGDFLSVVSHSKIIKLTDPKIILSSMGNIIRQIQTSNGEEIAASHELETIVPQMLKELQKTTPTGDLRVFALVYPPEPGAKDPFEERVWGEKPRNTEVRLRRYSTNLFTKLIKGGRLYRVTSGGAGWGKKAGLLSLEPVTELGGSAIEPEFPSFIFQETQDIRMPGSADLFPPGYIVQFIGTFHDTEGSKKDAITIREMEKVTAKPSTDLVDWTDPEQGQQFCLGNTALPETHQYTSLEDVDNASASGSSSAEATSGSLVFRLNRFGFLTTSALGLSTRYHSPSQRRQAQIDFAISSPSSTEDIEYKHSSLIELPNSYFLTKFAAGGMVGEQAAKSYTGSESSREPWNLINPVTLISELTGEESILFASQRLRRAERLLKDSLLARGPKVVRRVGTESEQAFREVPAELSQLNKYMSESRHEAIIQHNEITKVNQRASLKERTKKLMELEGLAIRRARRLRRRMMYRNSRLVQGEDVNLKVTSDATWRGVEKSYTPRNPDTASPFRYTPSDMPEELSEVFTNESSGSTDHRTAIDEERKQSLSQANPNDSIEFLPFDGEDEPLPPRSIIRHTISIPEKARHDLSPLMHQSAIFRTYSSTEVEQEEIDDRTKSEKDRKIIEALTTDLG